MDNKIYMLMKGHTAIIARDELQTISKVFGLDNLNIKPAAIGLSVQVKPQALKNELIKGF